MRHQGRTAGGLGAEQALTLLTPVGAPAVLDGPEGSGRAWGWGSAECRESQGAPESPARAPGTRHSLLSDVGLLGGQVLRKSRKARQAHLPHSQKPERLWGLGKMPIHPQLLTPPTPLALPFTEDVVILPGPTARDGGRTRFLRRCDPG